MTRSRTHHAAHRALSRRLDVGLITLGSALAEAAARDGRPLSV